MDSGNINVYEMDVIFKQIQASKLLEQKKMHEIDQQPRTRVSSKLSVHCSTLQILPGC